METYIPTQIQKKCRLSKKKKYRLRHRRMRAGQCAAARRALTAAQFYLDHRFPSLAVAALCHSSCVAYVRAAVTLLKSENLVLLERVLRGHIPLLAAAKQVKQVAALVDAYRTAGAADRVMFAKLIGPTTLFDSALVPAL